MEERCVLRETERKIMGRKQGVTAAGSRSETDRGRWRPGVLQTAREEAPTGVSEATPEQPASRGRRLRRDRLVDAWGQFLGYVPWQFMVTLTFDPRRIFPVSRQTAMREAVGWCHRLSWVVRRPVAWLVAVERGKAGLWHAHVLLVGAPEHLGPAPEAMWRQRNGFIRVTPVDTARGAVLYATKEAARVGEVELSDTLIRYRPRVSDRPCMALCADDPRQSGDAPRQSHERAAMGSAGAALPTGSREEAVSRHADEQVSASAV